MSARLGDVLTKCDTFSRFSRTRAPMKQAEHDPVARSKDHRQRCSRCLPLPSRTTPDGDEISIIVTLNILDFFPVNQKLLSSSRTSSSRASSIRSSSKHTLISSFFQRSSTTSCGISVMGSHSLVILTAKTTKIPPSEKIQRKRKMRFIKKFSSGSLAKGHYSKQTRRKRWELEDCRRLSL